MAKEIQTQEKKKLKKKKPSQETLAKVKAGEERLAKWKADQPRKYTAEDYNKAMEAQFRATDRENTSKDKRLFDSYMNIKDMNASYVDSARVNKDLGGKSKYEPEGDRARRIGEEKRKKELKKPPFNPDKNRQTYKNNQELISKIQARVNTLKSEINKMGDTDKKGNYTPKAGVDSTKFSQKWAEYEEAESRLSEQRKFGAKLQAKFDQNTVETGVKELKF